ncbi:MAG: FAD-binding monooxygenase, partial [Actinomycetales bacterium]|nr:FAD-binding monooxygenase [Actinomycetales bacterium]
AGVEVVTGTAVESLDPGDPAGAPAVVAGREADLVVGADGMHSRVRAALYPGREAVYSGFSSWRAIVPARFGDPTLRQYWGPRAEFGVMPVREDASYWYGYVALPERTTHDDELAAARARFADWAAPVREIIDATVPEALLRHDVHHLPGGLPRCFTGRVVMIGDAAHGFVPTMGQGAASALEDGLCVGLLVGRPVTQGADLRAALADFDRQRRPRTRALGRASLASARFGSHLGGGWRQTVRNAIVRRTPSSVALRGADSVMGWTPPTSALLDRRG